MIRKAVIPAAGLGTRFYPLTRAQPKEMLPLVDKPVIHYVVEEAVKSGLDEILIIVGAGKDAIINYFDRHILDEKYTDNYMKHIPDIYFIRQKKQLGLADSIKYAKNFTNREDFAVLLGDTVYRSEADSTVTSGLLNDYYKYKSTVIGLERVKKNLVNHYGIVSMNSVTNIISNAVEKPNPTNAPSNLAITGSYIFTEDIYGFLDTLKLGKNNEMQLTDAINMLCKTYDVYGSIIKGKRYDIGTVDLWLESFLQFLDNNDKYSHILRKYIR
ncbi:UTP--glucose-1-phosphate uridylyltransferase [Ferroplasma sp.]|jgi:UTP--glucose-1-phosphate uridylyltransferase|uniref:UTP--glucose-1-phosphate uridylyltransferase n=1 Tax=Ferroplasma sp. TaxID=2591003 RepID=UPI002625F20F|nr:UTP--glucose-1-phosphate uridylyltransferase [Ferroplasma sp.]